MNFKRSILPVTCGPAKGELYKEKMKQGKFPGLLRFSTGNYPCGYYIVQGLDTCVRVSETIPTLGDLLRGFTGLSI